jgi:hypothetical protein
LVNDLAALLALLVLERPVLQPPRDVEAIAPLDGGGRPLVSWSQQTTRWNRVASWGFTTQWIARGMLATTLPGFG